LARIASALDIAPCFVWVATHDSEDGAAPSLLLDAVGLHADMEADNSPEDREAVVSRSLEFQSGPEEFAARFAVHAAHDAERVSAARRSLDTVSVEREAKRRLCELAAESGAPGNRAEIFGLRAARAHAALCGRRSVE